MKRTATLLSALLLLTGLAWSGALAQIGPAEDHFRVYDVPEFIRIGGGITLIDQFGETVIDSLDLDKFATPVEKNNEPIYDLRRHQTWWRITQLMQGRRVTLENQFGPQDWFVKDAAYLVAPALKNETGTLPVTNHYECYKAIGPALNIDVVLSDQFDSRTAILLEPVVFCNPVEKLTPDGIVYPIVDPDAHLACYRLDPSFQYGIQVVVQDQFGVWSITLEADEWLCVPSFKTFVVPVERSTWGGIKARYSD
jgi:hypothetical protein